MPPPQPQPLLLVVLVASIASAYIEVVEESGCHDSSLRLTCRHLDASIAILEVGFVPDTSQCGAHNSSAASSTAAVTTSTASTTAAFEGEDAESYVLRPAINRRCSGKNTCSFVLAEDNPESIAWGPGMLSVKYACRDGANTTRGCQSTVLAEGGGFVQTPGYPSYYVGQQTCLWTLKAPPGKRLQISMLDISLRSKGVTDGECTDSVRVWEGANVLLDTCGEEPHLVQLLSQGAAINVSVAAKSSPIYPKRGVLFHYKAVGCGEPPPAPDDGYRVYRNETHALYLCCVGYAFADTHERERSLRCAANGSWLPDDVPFCVNTSLSQLLAMKLNGGDNETTYQVSAVVKEFDLMIDVLLPTMIICVLLVGNGVIIFVIFYLRKRKLPRDGDEEELGAICQPQDGGSVSDRAICV